MKLQLLFSSLLALAASPAVAPAFTILINGYSKNADCSNYRN
jgi:hypothetical protein